MSEFDALISGMDDAVFGVFGDLTVLVNPGVENHSDIHVDIQRNVEMVHNDALQLIQLVASIKRPPVDIDVGWQILKGDNTYTLREEIDNDGHVANWVITQAAGVIVP